jgi:hypothetical protein
MINEGTLHNWFGKSKSKDGKPGWVQSDGSPCANEPGEKGTPKCYSSRRLAGLKKTKEGKSKIRSADSRKSRQDPGQQSKSGASKPTMVRTFKDPKDYKKHKSGDYKSEGYEMQEAKDQKGSGSGTKDACYNKVKSRYDVWPSAYASGALVKCRKAGAANWGNSTKKEEFEGFYDLPEFTESQIAAMKYAGIEVEVIDEACWKGYTKKGMKTMFGKRYPNCVKKEEVETVDEAAGGIIGGGMLALKALKTAKVVKGLSTAAKLGSAASALAPAVKVAGATGAASGAGMAAAGAAGGYGLAKATEKKKQQQEEVTGGILVQDAEDFKPREIESVDIIKADPIKGGQLQEVVRTKVQTGNMYQVIFGWRGKMMMVKLFFPDATVPNRQKVANALNKMYPGSQLRSYTMSVVDYDDPYINVGVDEETDANQDVQNRMQADENRKRTQIRNKHRASRLKQNKYLQAEENIEEGTPAWQRKEGKSDSGGLNQAGVDSYRRSNPGSKLKTAVTKDPSKLKKGGKAAGRRKSFCSRMKGMKKKLTSSKTANDPDSRINKSLRKWNC